MLTGSGSPIIKWCVNGRGYRCPLVQSKPANRKTCKLQTPLRMAQECVVLAYCQCSWVVSCWYLGAKKYDLLIHNFDKEWVFGDSKCLIYEAWGTIVKPCTVRVMYNIIKWISLVKTIVFTVKSGLLRRKKTILFYTVPPIKKWFSFP